TLISLLCLSSTLQNHHFPLTLPLLHSPKSFVPPPSPVPRPGHSALPLLHSTPQPQISSPPILCSVVRPLPLPFLAAPPRTKTQKLKKPRSLRYGMEMQPCRDRDEEGGDLDFGSTDWWVRRED
ncbi:unnamed protein product, partial [Linum tenue]